MTPQSARAEAERRFGEPDSTDHAIAREAFRQGAEWAVHEEHKKIRDAEDVNVRVPAAWTLPKATHTYTSITGTDLYGVADVKPCTDDDYASVLIVELLCEDTAAKIGQRYDFRRARLTRNRKKS